MGLPQGSPVYPDAHIMLAVVLSARFGIEVTPAQVEKLIRNDWLKISTLAHQAKHYFEIKGEESNGR